jgi:hypothetical protein
MPGVCSSTWKRKVRERKLSSAAESRRKRGRPRVTDEDEASAVNKYSQFEILQICFSYTVEVIVLLECVC